MEMESKELLIEIGKLIDAKLEDKFELQKGYIDSKLELQKDYIDSKFESKFELQKDYIDSKFSQIDSRIETLRTDIRKDMVEFHQEIIADIGNVENKLTELIGIQSKDIQKLKLKVG